MSGADAERAMGRVTLPLDKFTRRALHLRNPLGRSRLSASGARGFDVGVISSQSLGAAAWSHHAHAPIPPA